MLVRDTGIEPVFASVLRYAATEVAAALRNTSSSIGLGCTTPGCLPSPPLCAGVLRTEVPDNAANLTAPEVGRLAPLVRVNCYSWIEQPARIRLSMTVLHSVFRVPIALLTSSAYFTVVQRISAGCCVRVQLIIGFDRYSQRKLALRCRQAGAQPRS